MSKSVKMVIENEERRRKKNLIWLFRKFVARSYRRDFFQSKKPTIFQIHLKCHKCSNTFLKDIF